jgi:hypothetical protein
MEVNVIPGSAAFVFFLPGPLLDIERTLFFFPWSLNVELIVFMVSLCWVEIKVRREVGFILYHTNTF